jgi:hypothetical protein
LLDGDEEEGGAVDENEEDNAGALGWVCNRIEAVVENEWGSLSREALPATLTIHLRVGRAEEDRLLSTNS